MKPFFLAVALFLAAITTQSFANDVKVTPATLANFHMQFRDAADVQWTSVNHLYRADFTINDVHTIAFFNKSDGALVVTSNYITVADLSRDLQRDLKKHTATSTLMELYVVQGDDALDYYATIEQAGQKIVLKSVFNKWVIHKKG